MDLAKRVKLSPRLADDEGVWFTFMGDAKFRVRSKRTIAYQIKLAEVNDRYRAQFQLGGQIEVEARLRVQVDMAAEYLLSGWENIEDEGLSIEFNDENTKKICEKYWQVTMFLHGVANELNAYQLKDDNGGQGN